MKIKMFFLVVVAVLNVTCSVNRWIADADSSFARQEYFAASEKYRQTSSKVKDKARKAQLYFMLAESYRHLGDYTKAAVWYKNAIRSGFKDESVELRYADALRSVGKPAEAKLIYEAELKKNPGSKWAANGIESLRRLQEWKETQELYIVENLKDLNSAPNDILVQIWPGTTPSVCLRSSRETLPKKKTNPATGQRYSDFFTSAFDSALQKWSAPIVPNAPPSLNSPEEELALSFAPDQKMIVVARTVQQAAKPTVGKLFYMLKNDGLWTNPEPIPFSTDDATYSDPMITNDGKTLWFASNRAGGLGGFDIWKAAITGPSTFSAPVHAGTEINTPGNETCPFQKPNGHLYFASDFHPGMGGYDLFQAQQAGEIWQINQLPPPVNSAGDDLSIRFYDNREKGFLTSNRKGSRAMDIYSFYLPPKLFQCFGKIHDSETDSILPDVNIRVVGSDGSSQKLRSADGQFQATLNPETDYAIVVFAHGYLNTQAKISTRGLAQAREFELNIKSVPINKPIRMDNINYESEKWDLLPEARTSLDRLADLLKLNPEALIEISAHTDDLGDEQFNLELSEKRAASVARYLNGKGIPENNMKVKGYGESMPLKISRKLAQQYPFVHEGETLNPETIEKTESHNLKEIARGLNRRTEFRVLQVPPDRK
jgi:peptidoglycan-associated lipoprotein